MTEKTPEQQRAELFDSATKALPIIVNRLSGLDQLVKARDALSNAIAWIESMHPTKSRTQRLTMYRNAHAGICDLIERGRP